ncbi:MAG: NAD(P)H-hydrate epimerase, partial [Acidimicrobiia bacterium]
MEPLITPQESGRLDLVAEDPAELLMERAGLGVALVAVEMGIGYGDRVTILAGRGNNGGDGYVAAKHLARRGVGVTIHPFGYPRGDA